MNSPISIKGQQLYEFLPDLYRDKDLDTDSADPHLQAYLDAHGVLLDGVRATLEQFYNDHFPDVPADRRVCQEWIISYLAGLVGFEPVSPFADGQRSEVANAIRWNQRKGTRLATDEIAEAVVLNEVVVQEGWQRVLKTAALDMPLMPAVSFGELDPSSVTLVTANGNGDESADASDGSDGKPKSVLLHDRGIDGFYQENARKPGAALSGYNPQLVARHPGLPIFTLNINQSSRAFDVEDEVLKYNRSSGGAIEPKLEDTLKLKLEESLTSQESQFGGGTALWPVEDQPYQPDKTKKISWIQRFRNGVPCFRGSYEDISRRSLDVHLPGSCDERGYYHPKRALIFMPPPRGMCADVGSDESEIKPLIDRLRAGPDKAISEGGITVSKGTVRDEITEREKTKITINGDPLAPKPDVLTGPLVIDGDEVWHLEHLRFKQTLTITNGEVHLKRCAIEELKIEGQAGSTDPPIVPTVFARDCLFDVVSGQKAALYAEFCTLLGSFSFTGFVWASEVIFPEIEDKDIKTPKSKDIKTTFECVRYSRVPDWLLQPVDNKTPAPVNPATNTSARPVFVETIFCDPGAGVLAPDCSEFITKGGEDGGEMGAYNAWRFVAQREALRRKLKDYLPLGIAPVVIWDKRLLCQPPRKKVKKENEE